MKIPAGATNVSVYYYIQQDASGTSPGEPVTGLLYSDIETGGSASYVRQGAARVDLTLVTLASASAAHSDGGFILVDDTNMPGVYRCDYPDAAFAAGVNIVICSIVVASANNAVASPILVDLDASIAQTGDSYARLGAPAGASIAADLVVIDNFVDGLETTIGSAGAGLTALATAAALATAQADLNTITGSDGVTLATAQPLYAPAVAGNAMALTSGERTTLAGVVMTTQMTESYRTDGSAPTIAQALCETLGHMGESSISGTTKTVKKFDGSTSAATFTLNDATTPTAITRAT